MILVKTNRPFKCGDVTHGIRTIMGVIHRVRPYFQKTYGEEILRCPNKDYNSLNNWQANWVLFSALAFCNLLFCNDAPMNR
jgi:hypothetical protein